MYSSDQDTFYDILIRLLIIFHRIDYILSFFFIYQIFICKKKNQNIMGMCSMCLINSQRSSQRHITYMEKGNCQKIQTQLSQLPPENDQYMIEGIEKAKNPIEPLQSQSNNDFPAINNENIEEQQISIRSRVNRPKSRFYNRNHKVSAIKTKNISQDISEKSLSEISRSKQINNKQQQSQILTQGIQIKNKGNDKIINLDQDISHKSKMKQHCCIKNIKKQIQDKKGLSKKDQQLIKQSQGFTVPTKINQQVFFQKFSIYQGEWMNGMRHGFGILIFSDHSRYEGKWKFDNINGKGKYVRQNGQVYEGQWKNNEVCGTGKYIFKDGSTYIGKWMKNMQEGMGIQSWTNGDQYVGLWSKGKKNGYGELLFQDGSYYKGQFVDNQLQGKGQYYWNQKKTYKGQWLHNQMAGYGTLLWQNGDQYEGQFEHDKIHGNGKFFYQDGSYSEGEWKKGRKHGEVIQQDINGQIQTVEWYFGKNIKLQNQKEKEYEHVHKTNDLYDWTQSVIC